MLSAHNIDKLLDSFTPTNTSSETSIATFLALCEETITILINAEGSEKEHQKTIELINAFNDEAKIHKEQLNKNEETFFLLLTHFYTINMLFQHYQFLYRDFPQRLSSEHFYTLWANFFTEIQQITYLTENQKNEVVDICRLNICAKLQHNDQQEFISALNRLFEIPLPHFLKKPFMSSDTAYKKIYCEYQIAEHAKQLNVYENIYEYTLHYSYERIGALLNCPEFNENNLTNADIDYHQLNTSPEKKQQLLEIINFLYGTEKLLLTHKTQHTKASDRNTIQQTNAQKLVLSTRLEIYKLLLNTDENNQESTWLDHIDTLQQTTTDVISHFMQELIEEKRKNLPSRDKKLSENPLLSSENKNKPIVTQHRSRSTSTKKKKKKIPLIFERN
ncbi:MAG: hypothetical protein LRY67_02530 [Gammaproteobacteria bacterium]|nr:hypothetical protein [Gammaproteobacteria bacterium]